MNRLTTRLTLLSLFLSMACCVMAERYTLSGYVSDAQTGERLIGATIVDTVSHQGTVTNPSGYYSLSFSTPKVVLQVSYVGYQPLLASYTHLRTDSLQNFQLTSSTQLNEVVVQGHQSISGPNSVQMSAVEVPIDQIKAIPAIGGEIDVIKALQLLPGVQSGNEGSAGMYVRGGGPDENLMMLDGVSLYSVNHMLGFFSVFNANAVKNVTLYKGNFPARYGSRLSSIIDVRQNDGNAFGYHGDLTIGLISTKLSVEGPIPFKKGTTTFSLSGRRTLYDLFVSPIVSSITAKEGAATMAGYYFYDVNAKLTHTFSDNDKLSASYYMGDDVIYANIHDKDREDQYDSRFSTRWNWGNILAAINYEHRFTPRLFSTYQLSFTRYHYNLKVDYEAEEQGEDPFYSSAQLKYNSNIMDVMFQNGYQWQPNHRHDIHFGCDYTLHMFTPEVQRISFQETFSGQVAKLDTSMNDGQMLKAHEATLYIEDTYSPCKWFTLNAGLRSSLYHVSGKTYPSLEPRLGIRALLYKDLAFKCSYSYMSQYVHMLSNSSVSLPTDLWVPVTKNIDPMRSMQVAAGLSYNICNQVELSVEGYYKRMKNLLEYKDGASYVSSRGWEEQVCIGDGWSYGVELLLQRKVGPVTGWLGYTWSRTMHQFDRPGQEINFGRPFHAKYDREHDLSLTLQWQINDEWSIAGTFVYGTGTYATFGLQKYYTPDNDFIYAVSERNNYQMPDYHRLDLGATWQRPMRKHPEWKNVVNMSVYNVYNHHNAFIIYPQGNKLYSLTLFPIMPSLSYSFQF